MTTITRPKVEKAIAPAKQWRNRWLVVRSCRDRRGFEFVRGSTATDPRLWPTKETAEQKASEYLEIEAVRLSLKYIGAFAVPT